MREWSPRPVATAGLTLGVRLGKGWAWNPGEGRSLICWDSMAREGSNLSPPFSMQDCSLWGNTSPVQWLAPSAGVRKCFFFLGTLKLTATGPGQGHQVPGRCSTTFASTLGLYSLCGISSGHHWEIDFASNHLRSFPRMTRKNSVSLGDTGYIKLLFKILLVILSESSPRQFFINHVHKSLLFARMTVPHRATRRDCHR